MPSWSIHLKIAKEVNKKYNLEPNAFLFGSVLPDTNKEWGYNRFDSHFYGTKVFPKCPGENMIDLDRFLEEYKDHLDDPLILGYYTHILTDNYYNEYVYYNKWIQENGTIVGARTLDGKMIPETDDHHIRAHLKHGDFELYGKSLYDNNEVEVPTDTEEVMKHIGILKNNFLLPEYVEHRMKFLNEVYKGYNPSMEVTGYKLMSKEELDNLLEGCIEFVDRKLEEIITKENDHEGRIFRKS